ncbi:response regulator transcription factor [Tabrizicola sp.]|uniref:response regulator transcription factor n=1 Tax=Tabrizicola sp. TaxID=2005166 RepID=UPI002FDDF497
MKVLLADDHWIVRDSLKHAMRSVGPHVEVLEAADFDEALELLRKNPDTALMLVDLVMPGFTEFTGLRMLRSTYPDIPIAVVSVHEERDYVIRAIEEGVIGYIPKSAEGPEVLRALTLVINGEVSFPRSILQKSDRGPLPGPANSEAAAQAEAQLTPREAEVHQLHAAGHSNAELAERLGLSTNTVRVHLRNISLKIGKEEAARSAGAATRGRLE